MHVASDRLSHGLGQLEKGNSVLCPFHGGDGGPPVQRCEGFVGLMCLVQWHIYSRVCVCLLVAVEGMWCCR